MKIWRLNQHPNSFNITSINFNSIRSIVPPTPTKTKSNQVKFESRSAHLTHRVCHDWRKIDELCSHWQYSCFLSGLLLARMTMMKWFHQYRRYTISITSLMVIRTGILRLFNVYCTNIDSMICLRTDFFLPNQLKIFVFNFQDWSPSKYQVKLASLSVNLTRPAPWFTQYWRIMLNRSIFLLGLTIQIRCFIISLWVLRQTATIDFTLSVLYYWW